LEVARMRAFLLLICTLALGCLAAGQVTSTGGGGSKQRQTQMAHRAATPRSGSPYVTLRSPNGMSVAKPTPAAGGAVGAGRGQIKLPPDRSGKTPEDRLNHYITTLRQPNEPLYPSDSLRHALKPAPQSDSPLKRFLGNTPSLDPHWDNTNTHLAKPNQRGRTYRPTPTPRPRSVKGSSRRQ
jgi:hypothetical protein